MSKKRQEALALMKKELSEEHLTKKYGTIWKENVAARKLLHANEAMTNKNEKRAKSTERSARKQERGGKRGRAKSEGVFKSGSSQDHGAEVSQDNDGPADKPGKVKIRKKVRKKISVKRIKPKLDKTNTL